jgi:predicted acylesterase/phospholipase RssA
MQFNVFLSGGGLKGAYQYGFFKELYKIHPGFDVKHVYASSVGALNAGPILVKRIDTLHKFWDNQEGKHPFETIVKGWCDYRAYPYKLVFRMLQHNAVFDGIVETPFNDFWNTLDFFDLDALKRKLTIVAYDTSHKKPVFLNKYRTSKDLYASVAASTRHPYLFRQSRLVDGNVVPFQEIAKHAAKHGEERDDWLILDLGGNKYDDKVYPYVYGPNINKYNAFSSFTLDTSKIKELVDEGEKDAIDFWGKIRKN